MKSHLRSLSTLWFVLLLAGCGGGSGGTAATTKQAVPKIINGTEVDQSELPQYVKVYKESYDGSWGGCTGTMISATAVLTAGHCVANAKTIAVQTDGSDGPLFYPANIYVGTGYGSDPTNITAGDIAVIVLQTPTGRPALSLLASRAPQAGDEIMVVGFGVDDAENGEFGTLRAGTMKIAAVDERNIYVEYDGETSNVCFGDSGGPAIYLIKDDDGNLLAAGIAGVVSAGTDSECAPGDITAYTSILPYLNSILAIVPDASLI